MTNTPPASKGIQIPQYVVLLAVLFTALGALLMASTGVDRRSLVRAEFTLTPSLTFTPSITPTPVDPFANLSYTTWTSADNLISMDVPAAWTAQSSPQRPVDTSFTAEGAPETGLRVLALPISALGIPELAANAPVDAVARAIFADVQPPVEPRAVEAGELKGVAVKQTQQVPDQVTGQTRSLDADIWVLSLDETHIAVIQAVALTADWPKMEPILARAAVPSSLMWRAQSSCWMSSSGCPLPQQPAKQRRRRQPRRLPQRPMRPLSKVLPRRRKNRL